MMTTIMTMITMTMMFIAHVDDGNNDDDDDDDDNDDDVDANDNDHDDNHDDNEDDDEDGDDDDATCMILKYSSAGEIRNC